MTESTAGATGSLYAAGTPPRMARTSTNIERLRQLATSYGVPMALVLLIALFSFLRPDAFPTWRNLNAILSLAAPLMVVALGLTIVLAQEDFDISFPNTIGLVAAITFLLMAQDRANLPWGYAVALALMAGPLIGLANGFLVAILRLNSLVATLAVGTGVLGIEFLLTGQQTVYGNVPRAFMEIGQGAAILGLNNQIWISGIAIAGIYVLAQHTELGRYFYAVGGNAEAARLSGIDVKRVRIYGFMLMGFLASVAGVLITAQTASSSPDSGMPYMLPAFAATFLGTAMFKHGQFNVLGTAVGVVFLGVIQTGLIMLHLSTAIINIVQGAILLSAMLISRFGAKS
jgi:ribose transport system permease protein